jgi:hypothetical protein
MPKNTLLFRNALLVMLTGSFLMITACKNSESNDTSPIIPGQQPSAPVTPGSDDTSDAPTIAADKGDPGDPALTPGTDANLAATLQNPITIDFGDGSALPTIGGNNNAAVVEGVGAAVSITLTGSDVPIILQGASENGSVTISGDQDFVLYLNGVSLTYTGDVISYEGSGKMNLSLVNGTQNRLVEAKGADAHAALYSKGAISVSGEGTLYLRSYVDHAIKTKAFSQTSGSIIISDSANDGLNAKTVDITGGSYTSRSTGDGIQGDDDVTITGGTLTIVTPAQDVNGNVITKAQGIKSDACVVIGTKGASDNSAPSLDITVYGDGSKCISSDGTVTVYSGTLNLKTAGNGFWDDNDDDVNAISKTDADYTSSCSGIKADGDTDGDGVMSAAELAADALTIAGGDITVVSTGTGGRGISTDASLLISGGKLQVSTSGTTYTSTIADPSAATGMGAMDSDRYYDKKCKGLKSDNDITINGGTIIVHTYTDGSEGIEGEYHITINGGTLECTTYDDAINASGGDSGTEGEIAIHGGYVYCNAGHNDGIDSNGTITVTGGCIVSCGASGAEEGFDCDNNNFTITGGTLVGLGGSASKPTDTDGQSALECNFTYASTIDISAANGGDNFIFEVPDKYSGTVCMIYSSPLMTKGTTYTVTTGGTISGGTEQWHGIYEGASYTGGTGIGEFYASYYATVGGASGSPGTGNTPGVPGTPAQGGPGGM